jgi:hypothetical protein
VENGAVTDEAGNELASASNSLTFIYDTEAPVPTLSSTESLNTNANPIPLTLSFTEPVYGLVLADLTVTSGTATAMTGDDGDDTFTIQVLLPTHPPSRRASRPFPQAPCFTAAFV